MWPWSLHFSLLSKFCTNTTTTRPRESAEILFFKSNIRTSCFFTCLWLIFWPSTHLWNTYSTALQLKRAFLAKIQNRTNEKSGMEILLLSKFLVMWSKTWMVVVFPIQVFGHVIKNLDGSGFSHPNFLDSSSFYHPTFLTVVFWQVFFCNIAPILNFCQECYYREI